MKIYFIGSATAGYTFVPDLEFDSNKIYFSHKFLVV
jgi:hypothetical protein